MWNLKKKKGTNKLTKQKHTHRLGEQACCQERRMGEGIVREFGMDMDTHATFKMDNQQGPTA